MWGGIVRDTRNPALPKMRVGGQTYIVGTLPGWIETPGTANTPPLAVNPDHPRVALYRVRRDWQSLSIGDPELIFDAADVFEVGPEDVTAEMQQALLDQYAYAWSNWPGDLGAPYVDVNKNGIFDPDVDEPGIQNADQMIWTVFNDLDEGLTVNLYGSPPMGLEIQLTQWAYKGDFPITAPGAPHAQAVYRRYRHICMAAVPLREDPPNSL